MLVVENGALSGVLNLLDVQYHHTHIQLLS